jgi:uncharacterized membrane protein
MHLVYALGRYVWFFLIYSFLGALIETLFRLVTEHHLYGIHGFLHLPIFPIYGIGALLIIFVLRNHVHHIVPLFFAGAILTTILEYIAHWLIELVFHEKIWDYSNTFLNIDGRVSLVSSIGFGLAAVALVYFIHPWLEKLFNKIPNRINVIIAIVVLLGVSTDIVVSVVERFVD